MQLSISQLKLRLRGQVFGYHKIWYHSHMSRPLRIQYPNAFYHIMNRGLNRRIIFNGESDYNAFLKLLEESVNLWKIRVHAFNLMSNHYHIIIETPLGNLSRAMRHIDGIYTQRYNRRHNRDGALFKGRYKSILIDKDSYLTTLVRYIHLNAVRARKFNCAIEDMHGSHRCYMILNKKPKWLTTSTVLSMFSKYESAAKKELDKFVNEDEDETLLKVMKSSKWPSVMGTKAFMEKIKSTFYKKQVKHQREIPQLNEIKDLPSPESIISLIAAHYNVAATHITGRCSSKRNIPRKLAIYMLRNECQLTYKHIGSLLGGLSYNTIGSAFYMMKGDVEIWEKLAQSILKPKT
ncbi:MAG: putative transposase [Candidatus Omnitrophota bacterium]|jgi:putative transposase